MFFKDDLFKNTVWIFSGSMVANLFNYLFQITMGRMLSVQTFGEMNALFSTMIIFSVPFASITNFLAKGISSSYALEQYQQANYLIIRSYKSLLIVGAVLFLFGFSFSKLISDYLKISSMTPVLLLFALVFVSMIIPIHIGVLQGIQRIKDLSLLSAGSGFFKYAFCLVLVAFGLGLNGIMIGTILSSLLIGYVSFQPVARHLKKGQSPPSDNPYHLYAYAFPVLLANLALAILTQADIILVKYFFPPHEAGIYSSAAIIGKIVMYLPAAIVISLFPMVAYSRARSESTRSLILKSLGMTMVLSGSGALILYLFSGPVVSFFFGDRFHSAVPLIGLFGLAMLPMALITIVMNYNLARGARYFTLIMLLSALIQISGIILFHGTLMNIVTVILISGLFCISLLFGLLGLEYYGKIKNLAKET
jgi:O-antigen/teichoic acid export membrane protein